MEVLPCLLLLVSSHIQTRNFLPEHLNIIIKQQLCGEGLPSLLSLHQVDVFQQKQGILQQIIYAHQTSQKKLASGLVTQVISPSLEIKYHHAGTESLYPLCAEKMSQAPQYDCPINLASFLFPFAQNARCLDRHFFLFFSHEVSHHKVRKVTDSNFCK